MTQTTIDNLEDPNISRILDLVLGRVSKRVHLRLDDQAKKEMQEVFGSQDDKKKEDFTKKYIPDFQQLFEEESEQLKKDLVTELQK